MAWEAALISGFSVHWLDHAEPVLFNVSAGPSVLQPNIGISGSPHSPAWRLRGHAGVPPAAPRTLRPAERLLLLDRYKARDEDENSTEPMALLETDLEIGGMIRLEGRLWRKGDERGPLWQDKAEAPRNQLQRLLSWAVFQAAQALGVDCPEPLTDWLGRVRTQSFSSCAHRAEGFASRVDTARMEHFARAVVDDPQWPAAHIAVAGELEHRGEAGSLEAVTETIAKLQVAPWDWLDLTGAALAARNPTVAEEALKRWDASKPPGAESLLVQRLRQQLAPPEEKPPSGE